MRRRREQVLDLVHALLKVLGGLVHVSLALLIVVRNLVAFRQRLAHRVRFHICLRVLPAASIFPSCGRLRCSSCSVASLSLFSFPPQRCLQYSNLPTQLLINCFRRIAFSHRLGDLSPHLRSLDVPSIPRSLVIMPFDLAARKCCFF